MKKGLILLMTMTIAGLSGFSQEGKVYPGYAFNCISPNGNYLVSFAYGVLTVLDNATGEKWQYNEKYNSGSGNYISDNGIIVGYTFTTDIASYWKDGSWHNIASAAKRELSYANGITPDGSRIVGIVTPETGYDMDGLMKVPCYWDIQEDGSYGEIQPLPYPDIDFTGRKPQGVTAVCISADGKTIAGQVRDYRGINPEPIIFRQGDDGEWTYELFCNDLFHPDGVKLPEYPGETEMSYPIQESYMSDAEIEEFEAAFDAWLAEYEETGIYDEENMPTYEEFMSPTEIERYQAALAAYQEWEEKYLAYDEALEKLLDIVPAFDYNNVIMTIDADIYATTDMHTRVNMSDYSFSYDCSPYVFNLTDGTYKKYPNENLNLIVSSLSSNGTVLASSMSSDYDPSRIAYILTPDSEDFITLYDFMCVSEPSLGSWMKEKMLHEYTYFEETSYGGILEMKGEVVASGIPFTNPEMTLIALGVPNFWNDGSETINYDAYGYILTLGESGIEEITGTNNSAIHLMKGGSIKLTGEFKNVKIYDISGKQIFSIQNPSDQIETNLTPGIYIIKAQTIEGDFLMRKVRF